MSSLFALALLLAPHDDSASSSRLHVRGAGVALELRVQTFSLFEVVPDLDANRDDLLTASELEAKRDEVIEYVRGHYGLKTRGEPLLAANFEAELVRPDPAALFPEPQYVDLRASFRSASGPLESLEVEITLFHLTSPAHHDYTQVRWNEEPPAVILLDRWRPRATLPDALAQRELPGTLLRRLERPEDALEPSPPLGVGELWRLGALGPASLEPLLLLILLIVGAKGAASAWVIALVLVAAQLAFLAPAALGSLTLPGRWLEITGALSVAYTAADNLLYGPRTKWPEALLFGAVQGFASARWVLGACAALPSTAQLSGYAAGQLAALGLVCVTAIWLARLAPPPARPGAALFPSAPRNAISWLALAVGLYLFVNRVWF